MGLIQLLLITDSQRFKNHSDMLLVIEQAILGGVDTVLLREKQLDSAKLLALASALRVLTNMHKVRLMIHSQADIAKAVNADGVHVSASAIEEISSIKAWFKTPILVSASCHHEAELKAAEQQGADFAFLSPVFPTQSHPGAPSLGAAEFHRLAQTVSMPVIALGGISSENFNQLQGVGVATISAVLSAENPKLAASHLLPAA